MTRLQDHIKGMSELDKLLLLRQSVNSAIKNQKSKEKALKSEIEYGFNRVGIRGGKFTTLAANSARNTDSYNKDIELIKEIVKEIF